MNKELEKVLDALVDKLEDPAFGDKEFADFCDKHPGHREELVKTWEIWRDLDKVATPAADHEKLRADFYQGLAAFIAGDVPLKSEKPEKYVHVNTIWRWAAIFIVGLGIGMLVNSGLFSNDGAQVRNGNKQLLAKLTSGESATDRLIVVQDIKGITKPENQVFEALFTTLINDPNVNVRLSAIETLLHFADYPRSRELLVNALAYQESPIVQITLAEVVMKLQEEGTLEEIRKLLESEKVDLEVKMHLEETLNL